MALTVKMPMPTKRVFRQRAKTVPLIHSGVFFRTDETQGRMIMVRYSLRARALSRRMRCVPQTGRKAQHGCVAAAVVLHGRPNGLELCCPAAKAIRLHCRATWQATDRRLSTRQPGQHQRVVSWHDGVTQSCILLCGACGVAGR